jgi:peptidoglycan/xylan/chitin deacetylase (PgdA/CDA1 family)
MKSLGEFLSVDDVVTLLERGDLIDGRYIYVTFDDGYKGRYMNAFPILQVLDAPAVFFVVPRFIEPSAPALGQSTGGGDRRIPNKQYLSWDECRQMADGGMAIESHSFSQAKLAVLDEVGCTRN